MNIFFVFLFSLLLSSSGNASYKQTITPQKLLHYYVKNFKSFSLSHLKELKEKCEGVEGYKQHSPATGLLLTNEKREELLLKQMGRVKTPALVDKKSPPIPVMQRIFRLWILAYQKSFLTHQFLKFANYNQALIDKEYYSLRLREVVTNTLKNLFKRYLVQNLSKKEEYLSLAINIDDLDAVVTDLADKIREVLPPVEMFERPDLLSVKGKNLVDKIKEYNPSSKSAHNFNKAERFAYMRAQCFIKNPHMSFRFRKLEKNNNFANPMGSVCISHHPMIIKGWENFEKVSQKFIKKVGTYHRPKTFFDKLWYSLQELFRGQVISEVRSLNRLNIILTGLINLDLAFKEQLTQRFIIDMEATNCGDVASWDKILNEVNSLEKELYSQYKNTYFPRQIKAGELGKL